MAAIVAGTGGRGAVVASALGAAVAGPAEARLARAGHFVVTNAKSHRTDPDVPLVVPEVNGDHLERVTAQGFGGGEMAITVGRIRPCPLLGVELAVLSHNTVGGAAGGANLQAELAVARGLVPETRPPGAPAR